MKSILLFALTYATLTPSLNELLNSFLEETFRHRVQPTLHKNAFLAAPLSMDQKDENRLEPGHYCTTGGPALQTKDLEDKGLFCGPHEAELCPEAKSHLLKVLILIQDWK